MSVPTFELGTPGIYVRIITGRAILLSSGIPVMTNSTGYIIKHIKYYYMHTNTEMWYIQSISAVSFLFCMAYFTAL